LLGDVLVSHWRLPPLILEEEESIKEYHPHQSFGGEKFEMVNEADIIYHCNDQLIKQLLIILSTRYPFLKGFPRREVSLELCKDDETERESEIDEDTPTLFHAVARVDFISKFVGGDAQRERNGVAPRA
jgi:hypothetical protein